MERKFSQWRLSQIAIIVFIGGVIGSLTVRPSLIYIIGALSGSLLLVAINLVYVIQKKKSTPKK